jgi:hypothetical protein
MSEPTPLEIAPPALEPDEPEGEGPEPVLEPEPAGLEGLAAGRVEVTTEDVAGMLAEAVPSSTV